MSNTGAASTDRPRGAALWALVVLGGGWVGVRIIIGGMDVPLAIAEDAFTPARSSRLATNAPKPNDTIAASPADQSLPSTKPMVQDFVAFGPYETVKSVPRSGGSTSIALDHPMGVATPSDIDTASLADIERAYAGQIGPLFLFAGTDQRDDAPPNWASDMPEVQAPPRRPFSLYAYLFYRPNGGEAAPFALYGGSQMYARADWRPFEGQARLTTPVATHSDWSLRGGAMAATGGQKGAARLDIGPVLTVQNGAMQGQVGWRFRVAGEAEPKSGPAITLSMGF